jgi:hypothetical protein
VNADSTASEGLVRAGLRESRGLERALGRLRSALPEQVAERRLDPIELRGVHLVAVRCEDRRGTWTCFASTAGRPLRATRDGIRASSWRADPSHEVQPDETVLRVLLTEQSIAGGQRAESRLLDPNIYIELDELVLRMFVTPRPGYQAGSRNPETPVRVALPNRSRRAS